MAFKTLVVALSAIVATSAAASIQPTDTAGAPAGTPQTRYCMRVEPQTGSRIESVECWTREEWAEQRCRCRQGLGQGRRQNRSADELDGRSGSAGLGQTFRNKGRQRSARRCASSGRVGRPGLGRAEAGARLDRAGTSAAPRGRRCRGGPAAS